MRQQYPYPLNAAVPEAPVNVFFTVQAVGDIAFNTTVFALPLEQ